ncbi:transcription factor 21 [Oncorhynchus clarkii lewisi]|uniref:transcription factor 21 n=1 Tax=Oncorhynchus clarkii lewisi TaxID=490388 RepID=UPI0039B8788F
MSTGSLSDVDDELLDGILKFGSSGKDSGTSNESTGESSNCEGGLGNDKTARGKKRKTGSGRKTALNGVAHDGGGKQPQRNAANARERARMRVLSKAFSRLKTTLPWVPPDTKLSKLDTLRLASSYIAHLRQILANDKYENGFIHPVNLTWPFMVAGKPENDLKEMLNTTRLCGTTAS